MVRKGAALRRVFALAGLNLAGLLGVSSTAEAQGFEPIPSLATPSAAVPMEFDAAPSGIAPVGYVAHHRATHCDGGACGCVAPSTCVTCESGALCDSCGSCGGQGDCGCEPCYSGWRCADPWYIGFSGGWAHRDTVFEEGDPTTFLVFEEGFAVNLALGYRFDLFRIEAEYSFMNHEVERAGSGGFDTGSTGNVNVRALMFNLYHDVDLSFTAWRPYFGAGLGLFQSELNSLYPDFFADPAAPAGFATSPINSTSDMPFAYQFRAGASLPLSDRTEFFSGYRYFKGETLTFASAPFASAAAPTFQPDGAEVHSAEFGLRVSF